MKVIGLTGGIASGKSTAASYAGERGAYVIDADRLGHKVYEPGTPGFEKVVETFGDDVVDANGNIDRRQLGSKVFADPAELKKLTDISWPQIKRYAKDEIEAVPQVSNSIIVLEAAVLLEADWQDIVDEVWTITVPPETAVERATARDDVDVEAVQRRIDAQISNEERMSRSDVCIENTGTLDDLKAAIETEVKRIIEMDGNTAS